MKKILISLFLTVAMVLTAVNFVSAATVKITFNDTGWGSGQNPTSNGLWKYEWLARETGVIGDMRWCTDGYFEAPFTSAAASDTHWYCRVRSGGNNMHPGAQADSIKTFICPSDGRVSFNVECNRDYAVNNGQTGNSVRVWVNNEKVWPKDSDQYELNDTSLLTVSLELDVKEGDLIRFMIGSLGNSGGDGVTIQEHSVTYISGGDNLVPELKSYTIACVGDSITEGYMTSGGLKGTSAFPYQLQLLLNEVDGPSYVVKNFGKSARTALKSGDFPYVNETEYTSSISCDPDVVIICFGANDSKTHNWNAAKYKQDYKELIKTYQDLPSKPTVYLFYTTYVADQSLTGCRRDVIQNEILPIQDEIAKELGCKIIDLNTLTKNNSTMYADGVHPNDVLQKMMAQYLFDALCSEEVISLTKGDAKNSVTMIDPSKNLPEETTPVTTKPVTTTEPVTTKPTTTKPSTTTAAITTPEGTTTREEATTPNVTTSPDTTTTPDTTATPDTTTTPDTTVPETASLKSGEENNTAVTVVAVIVALAVGFGIGFAVAKFTSKKDK